jgi:hypothetical protein
MAGLGAAIYRGNCTGHGRCKPGNIHTTVHCGTPCEAVPKKNIATMDPFNTWIGFPQLPLQPVNPTVLINGIFPILDQDVLTNHPGTCTQLVQYACKEPPTPPFIVCPTSVLCAEDVAGGGAHIRKATATSATVWINGKRACRVGDPLGPPCLSKISGGSPNVVIGA